MKKKVLTVTKKNCRTCYDAWDLVELENRTDVYRVYTYKKKFIFVGQNSNTVTDESRDKVSKILNKKEASKKEMENHCGKYSCGECPIFQRCGMAKTIFLDTGRG